MLTSIQEHEVAIQTNLAKINKVLKRVNLTAEFSPADEPECEDDEFRILDAGGEETPYSIQIGIDTLGTYYSANFYIYENGKLTGMQILNSAVFDSDAAVSAERIVIHIEGTKA